MFTTGFAARADTLTAAERADAVSYAVGLVAEFRRPAAGARVGTSLTVPAVEPPAVWAPDPTGRVVRVPTHLADRFAVYRPEPLPLAAGDLVQVTRNGLNALVCLGAALFVSVSRLTGDADSTRVASYVVSGVGFLGGGVILRDGFAVKGIDRRGDPVVCRGGRRPRRRGLPAPCRGGRSRRPDAQPRPSAAGRVDRVSSGPGRIAGGCVGRPRRRGETDRRRRFPGGLPLGERAGRSVRPCGGEVPNWARLPLPGG